jgi:hypothetical protein
MQSDTQQFLDILNEESLDEIIGYSMLSSKRQWKAFQQWMAKNNHEPGVLFRYKNMEHFNKVASDALRHDILTLWHEWTKASGKDKQPKPPKDTSYRRSTLARLLNI